MRKTFLQTAALISALAAALPGGAHDCRAADPLHRLTIPAPDASVRCHFPSVVVLSDGRVMCVYSGSDARRSGKLSVYAVFSSDHGQEWGAPKLLLDTPDNHDYDPSVIVIGQRVVVSSTATPLNESGITTSRTMAVASENNGDSWSTPYEIPMGRRYTSGKVNNGVVLPDGTALWGYSWEKNLETVARLSREGEMEEMNAVLISHDEGRTWTSSGGVGLATRRPADFPDAINGLCEPALAACSDGSVFMLCRTGLDRLYACRSYDGGRTWTAAQPTQLVSHNAPAALCSLQGASGTFVAVWNNSPTNRWPLSAAVSDDDCRTWSAPRDLTETPGVASSYPGAIQTRDGKVLVVYQQADSRTILGVRFDPGWLAGEATSADARADSPAPTVAPNGPSAPRLAGHFSSMPKPLVHPDGVWAAYFIDHEGPGQAPTPERQSLYARYSHDQGAHWTEPQTLVALPTEAGGFGYHVMLLDKHGEAHAFILCDAQTGAIRPRPATSGLAPYEPLARQRLDVWHVKSTDQRRTWTAPRRIWEGRAADLQSVTQLSNGRIVLPLSYFVDRSWSNRGDGDAAYTYYGQFDTTALYSDDDGASWDRSPSVLRTPTPDLASYGAVEPVALQLADGRVWMLLRTQLGRFYESFSEDGRLWTPVRPTDLKSSDSPASLTRLADGRLLMVWNNCQRHPYAQGSRHVLHASVSDDDGRTWRGCREVLRDPHRNAPPPSSGDHGVSYPFTAAAPDGSAIFSLWVETGEGRSLWHASPDWLTATEDRDDFQQGLDRWSIFGVPGAALVDLPSAKGGKALALASEAGESPATAVWNFPRGEQGRLVLKANVDRGARLSLQLTDHFSPPFDDQSALYSLFAFEHDAAENSSGPPRDVDEFELLWDCRRGICSLRVNGIACGESRQQHAGIGPSYLRVANWAPESGSQIVLREVHVRVHDGH